MRISDWSSDVCSSDLERVELAQRFTDKAWIAQFALGTVGAAYREFLETTGYSADGLAEVSKIIREDELAHHYAWLGRRTRDVNELSHVMTGYKAEESLGEACTLESTYAPAAIGRTSV